MITVVLIIIIFIIIAFFLQMYFSVTSFEKKLVKMTEAFKEKKFDVLIKYLDGLTVKYRDDTRVLWLAANMYAQQSQYILAMLQLQNIIDKASFLPEITELMVYKMMGRMFNESGNSKKALEIYEIASKLSFDDFDTIMETATLAYKNGEFNISNQYLIRALDLNSSNPTIFYLLADIAFKNKGYKIAKEYIAKAKELDSNQPIYNLLSGKISYAERNFSDAIQDFVIAFNKSAELKNETAILLGNSYYEIKDYQNAKRYYSYMLDDESQIGNQSLVDERYKYAAIFLMEKSYERALEQWKLIKTFRNIYLDVDEKIKTYTSIISNNSFRIALTTDIVEYLEKYLYNILTLNGYIVSGYNKRSDTLIYFTAMKKITTDSQAYLCAFSLDTSGNKMTKESMDNFDNYARQKQSVHAFALSIGGFDPMPTYDNIEIIETERFEAILEGVISFTN